MERKKLPPKAILRKQIRVELESSIIAVNKHLEQIVKTMNWIQLLANVHPNERPAFAWRIYKAGGMTRIVLMDKYPRRD